MPFEDKNWEKNAVECDNGDNSAVRIWQLPSEYDSKISMLSKKEID